MEARCVSRVSESPSPSSSGSTLKEHIAFVTGRLAESSLRRTLDSIHEQFQFSFEVHVLDVSVAALLTPKLVQKRLVLEQECSRVILPGYCEGDHTPTSQRWKCEVELGPKDLRDLPRWFEGGGKIKGETQPEDYGSYNLEIIAEINHAPKYSIDQLIAQAKNYTQSGADIIDIGCIPDEPWSDLSAAIRALKSEGFRLAIDTFDPKEIEQAVQAGVELVLSIHSGNLAVAKNLDCEVVAIPDSPGTLEGLDKTLNQLESWGVPRRLDPILEPLGFGFAKSLGRYLEVRDRYPTEAMMMGVGNLTELTDCDSAGINVLLAGICEELNIESVLTTEVIPWAQSSVKELDLARRLLYYAVQNKTLPKHLDSSLILLRDPRVTEHGSKVLEEMAEQLKDPSFRIFAERDEIHIMNRDGYHRGKNPFDLFDQLEVDDPSHAFYLGWEMAKAFTANQLGKNYEQDEALDWGFLTIEEESHQEKKKKKKDGGSS